MRPLDSLSHLECQKIITRIHSLLYLDIVDDHDTLNPDKPVSGADFIQNVGDVFRDNDLVPPPAEGHRQKLKDAIWANAPTDITGYSQLIETIMDRLTDDALQEIANLYQR